MRRALANRLGSPLGLKVQGILCYGKTGLFIVDKRSWLAFMVFWVKK